MHGIDGCPVSDAMLLAIREFRDNNGPRWKSELSIEWSEGHNLGCELQQVRNIIGPRLLYKIDPDTRIQQQLPVTA
jgi:hypothetical protein